jgi:hypothetical protein
MEFIKWIISIIITIALVISLIVFPFIYVADKMFLSEEYYTETLDEIGVYDKAYDMIITKLDATVEKQEFKEGMPKDSVDWIVGNVKAVLTREYIKELMEKATADMVLYLKGDTDEMPTFDLMPKYDELRKLTESQLDLEKVSSLMQIPTEGIPVGFLSLLGIVDKDGNINATLKKEMLDLIFENNKMIKEPFMISSPVEVLEYAGLKDPLKSIEKIREKIIFVHRSVMVLLMFISFLTLFLILIWIKKLKIPFMLNGFAYGAAALISFVSGTAMTNGNEIMLKILNSRINAINDKLASIIDINEIIMPFGKEIISKGMIFAGIAIMFFILSSIFKRRYKNKINKRKEIENETITNKSI